MRSKDYLVEPTANRHERHEHGSGAVTAFHMARGPATDQAIGGSRLLFLFPDKSSTKYVLS